MFVMSTFASLIGSQDFSGAVRLLDGEIDQLKPAFDATLQRLVQLYLNRGICNQRLQLNRKALKVREALRGMHDMTAKNCQPALSLPRLAIMSCSSRAHFKPPETLISQARRKLPSLACRSCCTVTPPPTHLLFCLQDFDAALALNPSSIKALLHKGQVLQALGKASVSGARPWCDSNCTLQLEQ